MQTEQHSGTGIQSLRGRFADFLSYNARWQTAASTRLAEVLARTTSLPPDALERIEYSAARMLGQPLSPRAWSKMTFNDKVTYRRLRSRDPMLPEFTDRMRMREYAVARLGEGCVPKLLRVADRSDAFADLEGPYVLKGNHGSGWVILVEDNRCPTPEELAEVQTWLDTDFGTVSREWAYRSASRLAFAEELLAPVPPDYKFFVFNGKPELILVAMDRFGDHRIALMRPDWTLAGGLAYRPIPSSPPPQPPNFDQMLSWATILSEDIEFLRVDLYDTGDRVLVGELTPYPTRGSLRFNPRELDSWLGKKWTELPR